MEPKPNDWPSILSLGKINKIAVGADSHVSHIVNPKKDIDVVVKEYDRIEFNSIDPKYAEEVLKQYYADTQKVKEMIEKNPNPLNQKIVIANENFSLDYRIVPQGSLLLERTKIVDVGDENYANIKRRQRKIKMSLGQKFFKGLDLQSLIENGNIREKRRAIDTQQIFLDNPKICIKLQKMVNMIFHYFSKKLNVYLAFDPVNVKPFLDKEGGKITVIITDLASNLKSYYESSPKFKKSEK